MLKEVNLSLLQTGVSKYHHYVFVVQHRSLHKLSMVTREFPFIARWLQMLRHHLIARCIARKVSLIVCSAAGDERLEHFPC